jgi:PAS domain S-box-containing protein
VTPRVDGLNNAIPTVEPEAPVRREQLPIVLAFGVGLALLLATASYGARENRAAREARTNLAESYEVLQHTLEIERLAGLMEAEHRAFLVTGEAGFERRREASLGEAQAALAALLRRTGPDSTHGLRLRAAERALATRHRRMQLGSARAQQEGLDAARAGFQASGSASIDPVHEVFASIRAQLRETLAARQALSERRSRRLEQVLVYGTGLASVLLLFAAWALLRQARRSDAISRLLDRVGAMQQAMLESGGLIIIAVRPDGVIRLFNRSAAQALGYRADEVVGRHTPALFHDEDEMRARAAQLSAELGEPIEGFAVFTALPRRGQVDRREWTYVRKDGSRFPVELAVAAVRDAAGRELGFIGMALDLTERRAAEDAVRELNASLEAKARALTEANTELESFSYSVSHDLRAPLRHIDGYARILEEDAGDQLAPELRHYLQRIAHSARRMGELIDDLLAFSRLARSTLQPQQVSMDALVREALREVGPAAGEVNIGKLPDVPGDPSLLRQVWTNLLSNALKYSATRGSDARVDVHGEVTGPVAVFEVRDNGVGFDMRYRDQLFRVFQRLHTQEQFEGTGIGLAIVQRILRRHGGRIEATAEPDRGASFRFELPLAETAT